jgi:hypothetical protein
MTTNTAKIKIIAVTFFLSIVFPLFVTDPLRDLYIGLPAIIQPAGLFLSAVVLIETECCSDIICSSRRLIVRIVLKV